MNSIISYNLINFLSSTCYCKFVSTKKKISQKDYKFGRYLQKIRKSKNITQEELAEKIGTSQTWIAYIETGRNQPNLDMLQKIAKVLGVKTKELIPF